MASGVPRTHRRRRSSSMSTDLSGVLQKKVLVDTTRHTLPLSRTEPMIPVIVVVLSLRCRVRSWSQFVCHHFMARVLFFDRLLGVLCPCACMWRVERGAARVQKPRLPIRLRTHCCHGALGGERREYKHRRFTPAARRIVVTGLCKCDHGAPRTRRTDKKRQEPTP